MEESHSSAEDSTTEAHAGIEVPAGGTHGGHEAVNPVKVDGPMVLWTWVTFALLAWVLHKFAWKPILAGLEKREDKIRKSVEHAEEITQRLEQVQSQQAAMIREADEKAKEIVAAARKAAVEAARIIENHAKEEAQVVLENARQDISAATDKAKASLRRESAEIAVGLARKILREELDAHRQKQLVDRLIAED